MFFRKKKTPKLVDIVPKVTHTDFVFNNMALLKNEWVIQHAG
jgi:hypothetical protein